MPPSQKPKSSQLIRVYKITILANIAVIILIFITAFLVSLFNPVAGILVLSSIPFIALLGLLCVVGAFGVVINTVRSLFHHEKINFVRLILVVIAITATLFLTMPYIKLYTEPYINSTQYFLRGEPSKDKIDEISSKFASYDTVKNQIDKCNVIGVKWYQYDWSGEWETNNLYIVVELVNSVPDSNARFGSADNYSLAISHKEQLIHDVKLSQSEGGCDKDFCDTCGSKIEIMPDKGY